MPFILTAQLDKTDGVLTVWMDGRGRGKERKTEGVEAGTARWVEERGRSRVCKLAADKQMEKCKVGTE